jgi:gluconolactonase
MVRIEEFRLRHEDFHYVGVGLSRPECILAEADGTLWIADDRSAVLRIDPQGNQERIGALGGKPNGIAMASDGSFFVANIEDGRLYKMDRQGNANVVLEELAGKALGAVNFVMIDSHERLWMSVSTRMVPRSLAVEREIPDGYVVRFDPDGPRIVASGFAFTNEIRLDAAERFLYVAETSRGRVVRLPVLPDGNLGPPLVFGPDRVLPGAKIDGITFDVDGNLWVTEVTRNALIVITPTGHAHTVFEDPEARTLDVPTSVTFCGHDLRTALVGSLKMNRIAAFQSPVAGEPLPHWSNTLLSGR